MESQSIQTRESYRALLPETLRRSVSAVLTRFFRADPGRRCFRVFTHSRGRRRGLAAASLQDLLDQVGLGGSDPVLPGRSGSALFPGFHAQPRAAPRAGRRIPAGPAGPGSSWQQKHRMESQSIQTRESYRALLPESLRRSVSAVLTRFFRADPGRRRFRVFTHSRGRRRGLAAASLQDLLDQAGRAFGMSCCPLTLVLEEDGTHVDSEDLFQSLPSRTPLMVLDQDQVWTQNKVLPSFRRTGVARLTFDLWRRPGDFLCLSVRASLFQETRISYDLECTTAKNLLRLLLRFLSSGTRLIGQILLCVSSRLQLSAADL